jgi:drug/metabolite transporter (DMT)-like permease
VNSASKTKLHCVEADLMVEFPVVQTKANNGAIAAGLVFAVFLWGANNTAVKYLVRFWPPIAIGSTRFLAAGLVLLALLRWTKLFGGRSALSAELKKMLWWRGGLSLAVYIVVFNWALKLTSLSHVALYLGAAPVWALLWEGPPERNWRSAQRYGAAALALGGVLVLFLPTLRQAGGSLPGEILGLACGVLWTNFGVQCRSLGRDLSGAEISAHTFWRAGLLLAPLALIEVSTAASIPWRLDLVGAQLFCVLGGGVVAFALWNGALRHWKTSQVYLFNNLIPLSNMAWANVCLGEPVTSTFWVAMALIAAGVALGQANWQKIFGALWPPYD